MRPCGFSLVSRHKGIFDEQLSYMLSGFNTLTPFVKGSEKIFFFSQPLFGIVYDALMIGDLTMH